MLFTESQLRINGDPMAVLNEATYLDENEALIRPQTIPIAENSRIGAYTVRFDDVHRLAESHGVDYIDAVVAIAESSGVDPVHLKVAVDEAEIICNPDVVLALPENGVVVAPLSENNIMYQYVLECVDLWSQMPDSEEADAALAEALIDNSYLETFLNEGILDTVKSGIGTAIDKVKGAGSAVGDFYTRDFKRGSMRFQDVRNRKKLAGDNPTETEKQQIRNQGKEGFKDYAKGALKVGGTVAAAGLIGAGLKKAKAMLTSANNEPKSVIGQKIAALRKVYQSWMQKAQQGGPGVGDKIKQAAAKLLSIIDALMQKMQHAAG